MPARSQLIASLAAPLRRALAGRVVALFNDPASGDRPVTPRGDGLFGPNSVAWRVHGDVLSMMVGGVSGLLLQMLEPRALAGVWDHSNFRGDMHGRLRRTARFIALITYGGRAEAVEAIARVNAVHAKVTGRLPGGCPYDARDPALLAWVHVAGAISFLDAWIHYAEPTMSAADQDRYFVETGEVARRLGAVPVPESRAEAEALIAKMRPRLRVDDRTRKVARLVLNSPAPNLTALPLQKLVLQAGVDLMPRWARRMHGFAPDPLAPLVRVAAGGTAGILRWAFAPAR